MFKRLFSPSAAEPVFMLAGLGNPGREHKENRHNIGFMLVDALAAHSEIRINKAQSKALVGVGKWEGCRVILVKPQTFMNLSGQAVGAVLHYYKVPLENLMVAHDDIDLPFGTLRIRGGGGAGGQKGVLSIIAQLGTPEFARLRFGVGRPPGQMDPADYVLQDFLKPEKAELPYLFDKGIEAFRTFISQDLNTAMNDFNASHLRDDKG